MKYPYIFISFTLTMLLMCIQAAAQVPNGINFQATARDASGNAVPNTTVQVRLSIIDSASGGTIVYQEQRVVNTSSNGTFSFVLGQQPVIVNSGSFDAISWKTGHLFLKIDYDPDNTSGFFLSPFFMKLSTVPFAFATDNVAYINPDGAEQGDILKYNSSAASFEPGKQGLDAGAGIAISGNTISNTGDLSPLNEIQTISISGDTLFISNGNHVRLPYAFPSSFAAPSVSTLAATDIQQYSAQLMGKLNPRGLTTSATFEWGTTPSYGQTVAAFPAISNGSYDVIVSATIVIESGTSYYYRLKADNAVGVATGSAGSFASALSPPHLTTHAITGIDTSYAAAGGQITHDGGAPVTDKGLCWSTSPNPLYTGTHVSCGTGNSPFNAVIQGLSPGTTYYLRAYAVNSAGASYGNEVSFITKPVKPVLVTLPVTNITTSTASGGGNITYDGGGNILQRGLCWSLSPQPDLSDFITSDSVGTGTFQSMADGLLTGRTYYVRAYATNAAGTSYGNSISFITDTVVVGDFYQGGIVAYLLEPGDPGYVAGEFHGIICTPSDLGNFSFGCTGTDLPGCEGADIGTGAQNTADIVAGCPDTTSAGYACAKLILNEYSDWHLPSIHELSKLYSLWTMGGVGYYYLSSTESGTHFAIGYAMASVTSIAYQKTASVPVRAVRLF